MVPSFTRRGLGRLLALLLALAVPRSAAALPPCPAPATLVVYAENLSRDAVVTLELDGTLRDPAATCEGAGLDAYAAALTCRGHGYVRCGTIDELRPGAWVHRLVTRVADSEEQRQARIDVALGGPSVSNVLTWTVFARAFLVGDADESVLRGELDAASAFTAATGDRALVGFDRVAFPGADDPRTIDLSRGICEADGRHAGLCLMGSALVIDALDDRAEPGAVVLAVGSRAAPVVRVYGADDVLRGLVLQGSTGTGLSAQADAIAITGPTAQGHRLEQVVVRGPTRGDGVSIEDGASAVLVESEVGGAAGVGVKAASGARAEVERSCLHDNRNGGATAIGGGRLEARQNVVQRNAPGSAPAGLAAAGSGADGTPSTIVTTANVVRFNGARGLSVTDGAVGAFADDYASDNQFAGARVESTTSGAPPAARFSGVGLVCNHNAGLSGTCEPSAGLENAACFTDRDCCGGSACCVDDPECVTPARCAPRASQGYGAVLARCAACAAPRADFGTADARGANAFTLNRNDYPNGTGVNLLDESGAALAPARGNQWEHCGTTASCDVAAVGGLDVRSAEGGGVDVADAAAARLGAPVVTGVSRGRPRAGELVHVFGRGFNAIDGAACARATAPVAACSAESPRVERQNRSRYGNLLRLTVAGETTALDVVAVTPTMLAFRMPFDCFAPAALAVSRRDAGDVRRVATASFCDAGGCADGEGGEPCDDGSVCTVEDSCGLDGQCVPGPPLACGGPCMRCDPVAGCVPQSSTTSCDDGNACTIGDHCRGDADVCVSGTPAVCDGKCLAGTCDPTAGCVPAPASQACTDGNACTTDDHCRGDADVCVGGAPLRCSGTCLLGSCDPANGCRPKSVVAVCSDGDACTARDHCQGDADVCVSGPPTTCDDGDPCTVDDCASPAGCRHVPLVRYDALRCRFEHLRGQLVETPGVTATAGRGIVKVLARALVRAEAARQAEVRGDGRALRRHLAAVGNAVRRLRAKVERGRGLPPTLPARMRPLLEELGAVVAALRAAAGR